MGCGSSKNSSEEESSGHPQISRSRNNRVHNNRDGRINRRVDKGFESFENERDVRRNTGAVVQISASNISTKPKQLSDVELLCYLTKIDYKTSENVVEMFKAGNTIPFMCRYRRHKINNMDAEE